MSRPGLHRPVTHKQRDWIEVRYSIGEADELENVRL